MKNSKSKTFLAGAVFLFAILLAAGCRTGVRKGVEIGDDFFYKINSEVYRADKSNYLEFQAQEGETVEQAVIVLEGEEQTAVLRWTDSDAEITFSDGTVINGTWENGELLDNEGMPILYSEEYLLIGTSESFSGAGKAVISEALCRISRGEEGIRGSVWSLVFGTVFYIWGVVIIRYPEESFFFLNRWRYRDAELSEAGKAMEQMGGAVILAAGAVFLSGIYLLV